ncbi:MAG: hypothetical protein ACW96M_07815 [Candidatus Thorarchaeota archaeon]
MRIRKWLMKQQWRIVQIRGIWGLFYGVLVLAGLYYEDLPFFNDLGSWGPFALAFTLLTIFLIVGYLYDRIFIMWAPSQEVTMERNPFQYVPSPKDHIFWLPIYSSLLEATQKLAQNFGVDTQLIEDAREHYSNIQSLRPERREDIDTGAELREQFVTGHNFWSRNDKRNGN